MIGTVSFRKIFWVVLRLEPGPNRSRRKLVTNWAIQHINFCNQFQKLLKMKIENTRKIK